SGSEVHPRDPERWSEDFRTTPKNDCDIARQEMREVGVHERHLRGGLEVVRERLDVDLLYPVRVHGAEVPEPRRLRLEIEGDIPATRAGRAGARLPGPR